jgi:hypothetical protein
MKHVVLRFGLIAGAILAGFMLVTMPFHDAIGWENGMFVGYATMVLAFLMVYFGVRAYRDTVNGGSVTFARALGVGMLIVLVASLCYVATWQLVYFKLMPGFRDRMLEAMVEQTRKQGASEAEIEKKRSETQQFLVMYDNPAVNAAITLLEPLPVGLVFALVSAGVLRRRPEAAGAGAEAAEHPA